MLASICAARFKTVELRVCALGVDTAGTGAAVAEVGKLEVTLLCALSPEAFASPG